MRITTCVRSLMLAAFFCLPLLTWAQPKKEKEKAKQNWQNLDLQTDGQFGMSTEKAYTELLNGKPHTPVIVAVIDGGVDVGHEDLEKSIWTNTSEIDNNKTDDDKNGYPDDMHGWNFLGSAKYNVQYDNMEITRLLRRDMQKYKYANPQYLKGDELANYKKYQQMDEELNKKLKEAEAGKANVVWFTPYLKMILKDIGKNNPTRQEVLQYFPQSGLLAGIKKVLIDNWEEDLTFEEFKRNELEEPMQYFNDQMKYHLNMDFDSRDSVGDNYNDATQRFYGNNRIDGPGDDHGTHVAGIIGATRDNDIGVKGVANDVRIMSIRAVPNGDERDKDVANAIKYAAENGARVINMSFGKGYSYDKKAVDDAVKFAMSKDILIVHAAGNENADNDVTPNYPTPKYDGGGKADGWIEVGASGYLDDSNLKAHFSNYGKTTVDVFAPGMRIYSTQPGSKYRNHEGTSMAAPMVAGVAALIRSYYPKLTAVQVKEVIVKSVTKVNHSVKVAIDKKDKLKKKNKSIAFEDLCVSGGIVNTYEALKLAATY